LKYPAIGFIMVRSEKQGTLAIGAKGTYYLLDDHFDGENPLAAFGPLAAQHLRREDECYNTPDILVNSFYDPKSREVAAFEELVGSHGGLGGDQSRGVLIYPSEFNPGSDPIVGAASLHSIIKRWLPAK
jgi:putative membrane protein